MTDAELAEALDQRIAWETAEVRRLRRLRQLHVLGDLVVIAGDAASPAAPTATCADREVRRRAANDKRPPAGWIRGEPEPWREFVGVVGVVSGGGSLAGVSGGWWGPV
jgi:hypothetical protein